MGQMHCMIMACCTGDKLLPRMALLASYMAACLESDLTTMWTALLVIVKKTQASSEAVRICGWIPITIVANLA